MAGTQAGGLTGCVAMGSLFRERDFRLLFLGLGNFVFGG
jgi:hypothetical protein